METKTSVLFNVCILYDEVNAFKESISTIIKYLTYGTKHYTWSGILNVNITTNLLQNLQNWH